MKVLITDEHSLFRDGLSLRLKEINENIVILQSSSLIDMQKILSHETDTDLVILDIDLADINTAEIINKPCTYRAYLFYFLSLSISASSCSTASSCGIFFSTHSLPRYKLTLPRPAPT